MTETDSQDSRDRFTLIVGAIGIVALLMTAMGYAVWESGRHYESEQINQFVLQQSSADPPR